MLEKASEEWLGGNSYFAAGAIRSVHGGLEDVLSLVEPIDRDRLQATELPAYSAEHFREDMNRLTEGRAHPALVDLLINDSRPTLAWLAHQGIPSPHVRPTGSPTRWSAATCSGAACTWAPWMAARGRSGTSTTAVRAGIELRTGHAMTGLIEHEGRVTGVRCRTDAEEIEIAAPATVIADGGFEADPRLRALYLGSNWDVAKVRGTPHNTGEALEAMLAAGALPYGHWSGCHSIAWDAAAPATGDRTLTNRLSRQSYPLGLVVNRDGERFLDEGADFRQLHLRALRRRNPQAAGLHRFPAV